MGKIYFFVYFWHKIYDISELSKIEIKVYLKRFKVELKVENLHNYSKYWNSANYSKYVEICEIFNICWQENEYMQYVEYYISKYWKWNQRQ